ncbi:MAG: ferritin-like domain-containing protein [Chromatiales bacterium]|jgi:uncharacterized ferritin-like protein (DUF455 family)|nr:ferritin-like domain-containing protein [Chromatiales bacterium]
MKADLFDCLAGCLAQVSPAEKAAQTKQLFARYEAHEVALDQTLAWQPTEVGRPARPALVHPKLLPRRRIGSSAGHAALIHAIAHIEFNAINLALDAAHRFRGLPTQYYEDWLRVASEESTHFQMLSEHLRNLGSAYGDFDAHDGLWQMAVDTAHDPLIRMALVPRVLEARGLDVTPGMMTRLRGIGDVRGVEVLEHILRDEVTHVRVGTTWFEYLCEVRGVEPRSTFEALLGQFLPTLPKGPFHREARLAAGFSNAELDRLEDLGRKNNGGG